MIKNIINPFDKYSEKKLILIGILFFVIGGFLAGFFNGRFDGLIDLHFVKKVLFYEPFVDLIISIIVITILLFLLGKYINKKTRFVDMLSTSLISKIPFYFLLIFNYNNTIYNITENMTSNFSNGKSLNLEVSHVFILVILTLLTLLFLIWTIFLLFNGFKTAANSKNNKHTLILVLTIVIAEIISKILILNFN